MALFGSSNPFMKEEKFQNVLDAPMASEGTMTVSGAVNKTFILTGLLLLTSVVSYLMPNIIFMAVGDFTGAAGQPIPMQPHEIDRMLGVGTTAPAEPARVKIEFNVGDGVKIKDGAFEGFDGQIEGVDEHSGKITVLIEIFGRPTPVDLESWQVERT